MPGRESSFALSKLSFVSFLLNRPLALLIWLTGGRSPRRDTSELSLPPSVSPTAPCPCSGHTFDQFLLHNVLGFHFHPLPFTDISSIQSQLIDVHRSTPSFPPGQYSPYTTSFPNFKMSFSNRSTHLKSLLLPIPDRILFLLYNFLFFILARRNNPLLSTSVTLPSCSLNAFYI